MLAPQENQRYTYSDYYTWDDGERWELINGEAIVMSPAPSWHHQDVHSELFKQFAVFLDDKAGKVFSSPFDVRLNADTFDNNVVQPDIIIFCDRSKLDGTGCKGAPDMTIEILSPSSIRRDRIVKLRLYQDAGVREYWIVDPDSKTVSVHTLENGKYIANAYSDEDVAPVSILDGCEIDLRKVFRE